MNSFVCKEKNIVKPALKKSPRKTSAIDAAEYNILHIDAIIKSKLTENINALPKLQSELTLLIKNKKTPVTEIDSLRKKIQSAQTTFELGLYLWKTADIIAEYTTLINREASKSFVYIPQKTVSEVDDNKRTKLIHTYISIARNYVTIENYKKEKSIVVCLNCSKSEFYKLSEDEAVVLCVYCGIEVEVLDESPSFKDTERINMSNRYTYSRKAHFVDAVKKYQGKQHIASEELQFVIKILVTEMKYNNINAQNTTKDNLYAFLSEKKMSKYYDDINLLFYMITGTECPDLSLIEHSLMEIFELQEEALTKVNIATSDPRANSINVYYKLYKLLQRLNYPCKKTDFFFLKTKVKEDEHDEKMKLAWSMLEWDWVDTF